MSYNEFAYFYDSLTDNVRYDEYADYIKHIFDKYGKDISIVLDVACGTGNITQRLCEKGYDMIGVDASEEMLGIAQEKMYESGKHILYLCQRIEDIDMYGTVDAAVCTLDSINHIDNINDLKEGFEKISLFMNKGGIFLFDVNTLYKHKNILADNSFVYETDDVFCVWQNFFNEDDGSVDFKLDFFEENEDGSYERYEEEFSEYYYSDEILTDLLEKSGFELVERFSGLTEDAVKEDTDRIIYIARKK